MAAELNKQEKAQPTCAYPKQNPDSHVAVTASVETWQWVAGDLIKRKKRLSQSVLNPKTRPNKREKRDHELSLLTKILDSITQSVII